MFRHRSLLGIVIVAGLLLGLGSWISLAAEPTAEDLFKQGMQKYAQGDDAAALQTLRQVDAMQLAKEQRVTLFETLQDLDRRMHQKAAPDDLLKQAVTAQTGGDLPGAVTLYEEVQSHPKASAAQKDLATARLAEIHRAMNSAQTAARQSIDAALVDVQSGKLADAQKKLLAVKAQKLDLGWFDNERVDRALALIAEHLPAAAPVAAAKPVEEAKPVATKPVVEAPAVPAKPAAVAAAPVVPAPAPVVKPAAKPVVEVPAAPAKPAPVAAAAPVAPPVPAPAVAKPAAPAPVAAAPAAPTVAKPATPAPTAAAPAAAPAVTPAAEETPKVIPVYKEVAKPVVTEKPAYSAMAAPQAPKPEPAAAAAVPTGPAPAAEQPAKPAVAAAVAPPAASVPPVTPAPAPAAVKPTAPAPVAVAPAPTPAPAPAPVVVEKSAPVAPAAVVEVKPAAVPAPAKPSADLLAQAKVLYAQQKLAEGQAAEAAGNFRVAEADYQDGLQVNPGQKELQAALAAVQAKLTTGPAPKGLLESQVASQQLLAEAALAEFQAAMTHADELLKDNNFAAAREAVAAAKLSLDRRQAILPAATYDALRKEATDKSAQIASAEQTYEAQQLKLVAQQRSQEQEASRQQVLREREEEIQRLLKRAVELRKEQKYDSALEALNQALFIDPNHIAAHAMKEMIEETALYVQVREDERRRAMQIAKHQANGIEATIPYTELLTYPADWPELTYRRLHDLEESSGEPEANREVYRILQEKKLERVEMSYMRFGSAIDYLKTLTGLNIVPNWTALQQAGADEDKPVTLLAVNVNAETVLTRVLEQVTVDDTNPIIYTVDNGVVDIIPQRSLKADLLRLEIYDVSDLMHIVPDNRVLDYRTIGGNLGGGGEQAANAVTGLTSIGTALTEEEVRTRRQEVATALSTLIVENVGRPSDWFVNNGTSTLQVDENNKLIVRTSSRNHQQLRGLLEKLRASYGIQISVEGRFLAVTQNFLDEFGLSLGLSYTPNSNFTQPITFDTSGQLSMADRSTTPVSPSFGQGPVATSLANLAGTYARGAVMGFTYLDDLQLSVIMRATQARRNITTLNAPRVTLLNGKNAQVNIYRTVAYISDLEAVTGAGGFNTTIDQTSEGVFLEIEGAVGPDRRYVTMNVYPKLVELIRPFRTFPFSAVVTLPDTGVTGGTTGSTTITGNIELPEIRITEVRTSVVVPDRGTLLLGGQRLVGDAEVETGVPILSKIPVVSRFFTNTSTIKDEAILLVMLKPTIIIPDQEEDTLFPGLRDDPAKFNVGRNLSGSKTYGVSGVQGAH